ncbi:MAG: hypothetical protein ACTSX6_00395 [Candidatus Heimdallarchaeaceae archaeon]
MKKRYTTIQLPNDLYEQLERIKEVYGASHNFVIEQALRVYLSTKYEIKEKN